nr:MAG TPA: hypothetical protein [Caudoviricetes sp.]
MLFSETNKNLTALCFILNSWLALSILSYILGQKNHNSC